MVEEGASIYPTKKELPMREVEFLIKNSISNKESQAALLQKISQYNYF